MLGLSLSSHGLMQTPLKNDSIPDIPYKQHNIRYTQSIYVTEYTKHPKVEILGK